MNKTLGHEFYSFLKSILTIENPLLKKKQLVYANELLEPKNKHII
jgi:hypothetical protein